ncbi:GTPase SAR1 family protein [Friedmanniella endophytica]|uniref:GTPase SAR1 family protein n=1 Tax=Microlunatus kandeliicorticis TaxID=1759536 RepID=A0A7W3ITY0_9ACTN|nr:ATP/GTP-binding protein [Microlunatus kandeliicorticis]MBA8795189.1 GTPase SAR1 family protein [Microlunatus kandeliicorticis]
MPPVNKKKQSIAVFGESGSGKTVLLSSFYGAAQEPGYAQANLFHLLADDAGQGTRLHQLYLRMRDDAQTPVANNFRATSYSFSLKFTQAPAPSSGKVRPFEALELVWHDYPGEWFNGDVSGPEEARRRVDTFRDLLSADVALLLVDGQRMLDHAGQEERYLRSLLSSMRNALLGLRDELLTDGKRLVQFPRIWIFALSKSDLLPETDVWRFRDLMIARVGADIQALREVIETMVESEEALAVGEDFALLSSAKFDGGRIEFTQRVGVDLILPIAAMLPVERHLRWASQRAAVGRVAEQMIGEVRPLVSLLTGGLAFVAKRFNLPGPLGAVSRALLGLMTSNVLDDGLQFAANKLKEANSAAMARHDHLRATLARFGLDLKRGEEERTLLRSER